MAIIPDKFMQGEAREFIKVSLSYTDFTDVTADTIINLFNLPAGSYIEQIVCKTTTSFTGIGASAAIINIGDQGSPSALISSYDAFSAPSGVLFAQSAGTTNFKIYDFDNSQQLTIELITDLASNNLLTAGAIDVYLKIGKFP